MRNRKYFCSCAIRLIDPHICGVFQFKETPMDYMYVGEASYFRHFSTEGGDKK